MSDAMKSVEAAAAEGKLTQGAVDNIRIWLTEPRYEKYAPQVVEHIDAGHWQKLDDVFWTVIPFGTGGRRGRMYPIGSNAINDATIGESAQGLAEYVAENNEGAQLACAIAYDPRHNSRHFAELCAGIMVANGFTVYFLDDYRSTPELSFLVRYKNCSCGIMVTASHNPPSDNAVKAYWSTGGQIVPPHDKAIIERVMAGPVIKQAEFAAAVADGKVIMCTAEVDAAYIAQVKQQSLAPGSSPRELKVIYSPLHGVGSSAVVPALDAAGFTDVEVFAPHAEPNGDFPNVPGHVSNPENRAVFDAIIERARETGADLILATDPDCDRMGAAAPVSASDPGGEWYVFNGNQIGALMTDYVLSARQSAGTLTPDHYVAKTLVTTELIRSIADSYNVRTEGNLQVGFKWIGELMDIVGPDHFVFGSEESHGYLVGQYARDKDGGVACMLMAELAAKAKADGQSLYEKLQSLYTQHGYYEERLLNVQMEGSEGMANMKKLMSAFRSSPPTSLAGIDVASVLDYEAGTETANGETKPFEGPRGNMVFINLAETGNAIAVRPSGTEPKVKFYMFSCVAPDQISDLEESKAAMASRLAAFESDLRAFADAI